MSTYLRKGSMPFLGYVAVNTGGTETKRKR